jgi:hypothetical protein
MDDSTHAEIPDFASLAADPEIAALLNFEPVPRKIEVPDGWGPDKQREVIARLCVHGSANRACDEMGMHRTGLTKLYKSPKAKSFRAAWDEAVALAKRRRKAREAAGFVAPGAMPPTLDGRRKAVAQQDEPLPGQVRNEHGEWEDQGSFMRRGEEAKDSIREKLLRARRLYLMEISGSAGKRAAFEILTELPIDWDKAARMEPQPDEPWNRANQRQPDMILTAENGWSFGEFGYGPDRKAELMQALNEELVKLGKPPIDWSQDGEDKVEAQSVRDRGAQAVRGTAEHHDDEHSAAELRASSPSAPQDKPVPSSSRRPGPRVRRV